MVWPSRTWPLVDVSVSSKAAAPVTWIDSETFPTSRLTSIRGCSAVRRMIPLWMYVLKPAASIRSWYVPGFRFGMYHVPSGVLTLPNTNPESAFVTVIFAPGTTAPDVSVTAPVMVAVPVEDCAASPIGSSANGSRSRRIMAPPTAGQCYREYRSLVNPASHCQERPLRPAPRSE